MLRVLAPVSIGETIIAPRLIEFLEKNPHVRVDLHFSDDRANLIADGFDLAIRTGTLTDSELVSRREASATGVGAAGFTPRKREPSGDGFAT